MPWSYQQFAPADPRLTHQPVRPARSHRHRCHGLTRLLATTTASGREEGLAQSATGIPGPASDPYKYAAELADLEQALR